MMTTTLIRLVGAVAVGVACTLVWSAPALAENGVDEEAARLYNRMCGACHGLSGEGDGIVSGLMTPRPTDLTILRKNNGGKFPFMRTMHQVDGTLTVRAHGDPDMPVWGEILRDPAAGDADQRARVIGRTMLIVKHVQSLQK